MKSRILVVDDDAILRKTLTKGLGHYGFELVGVESGEDALKELGKGRWDVVLADLQMMGMDGFELCQRCQEVQPGIPVIVLTGFGNFETAIAAIRAGAYDFLSKPAELEVVALAVERAVAHRQLTEEVNSLREQVRSSEGFGELIGESPPMRALFDLISRVSGTDINVLIFGESGTGKELVARALHDMSRRKAGPFIAVNCAALPEALFESELFGHVKGSFTGASSARSGLLVEASEGTLFLDEIGDMPLSVQSKVLRALENRTVRPVGGHKEVAFNARLVAASNKNLEEEVKAGRFREDLYYRLDVVQISLAPLRARGNDKLLIAQHFIERFAKDMGRELVGLSPEAAEKILAYDWPGNARELRNCIERAIALARFDHIAVDDLSDKVRNAGQKTSLRAESDDLVPLEVVERRYILQVLEKCGGNRSLAARILGVDRKTLRRKIKVWDEEPDAS
ncbi:MAG: sigma-54 dependent transcriptional regulator [Planctomycetota bacterium]|nr:sigma-54 dependent transcriptional regulator [Planctomycetota bacterium]